jgi:sterol desaturase/sphingolipid hydroxylase (fatty acid hydroxylase superfamily)
MILARHALLRSGFGAWLTRRTRRRGIMLKAFLVVLYTAFGLAVILYTVVAVAYFRGNDSWPTGIGLALLILYFLRTCWQYWFPDDDETEQEEFFADQH